jgi:alkylation response protein AidB-like acyl-CoA dehydrogenase
VDFRDGPEHARFRARARAWLEANVPAEWRRPGWRGPSDPGERLGFVKGWQRRLYEGGFAGLAWPREVGGQGAGIALQMIWAEEYARACAPDLITLSVGTSLVGPVLIAKGEPWQRERFLRPILAGEELWCQGFSEPGAGSDLAALRTRGEVRGDEIVVTGQKIWTSFAQHADWCILVVRTDPGAPRKHEGLTFLLVDMRSPGIEIRPLTEMTGEDWFNEVFFDGVRVPRSHVVGEIGGGWDVVVNTLSHERSSSAPHAKLEVELGWLRELARRTPGRGGGAAADDPVVRQELARCSAEVAALRVMAWRNAAIVERTGLPGPQGSLLKLGWSELDQRVKALAGAILGPWGLLREGDPLAPDGGHWSWALLWSRAASIYAGTSEVQRNIISERVLGLPRG